MIPRPTIAIIEDNYDFRENLEVFIFSSKEFELAGSYGNAESAYESLRKRKCQLLLVDIGLPGMSGVEFISKIKDKQPHILPIVISVFDDHETIFEALKAGAVGYLNKNIRQEDLIHSLHSTMNGGAPMSPSIARKVVSSFEVNRNSPLSLKESQVLSHLSKGLSYSEVADKMFVSGETIKSHIKNIYRKLEVNSKSQALEVAHRENLI